MELSDIGAKLDHWALRVSIESDNLTRYTKQAESLEQETFKLQQAVKLCELCLKEQTDVKQYIDELNTSLLQAVLGSDIAYKLKVVYQKDGVTVEGLEPVFIEDGDEDFPEDNGDGAINISGIGNSLIFLLYTTELSPVLILDEPINNVNNACWRPFVKFILDLQRDTNFQLILTTHSDAWFPCTYHVEKYRGISTATKENLAYITA